MVTSKGQHSRILIVHPSPDFIVKWITDQTVSNQCTTYFAVPNQIFAELYYYQFPKEHFISFPEISDLAPVEFVLLTPRSTPPAAMESLLSVFWGYTDTDGDTHTATCTLCGKDGGTEHHSYTGWKDNGNGTHTGTCVCGAAKTEAHNHLIQGGVLHRDPLLPVPAVQAEGDQPEGVGQDPVGRRIGYVDNKDGQTHSSKCNVCDYIAATENHSYDETTGKCVCGASKNGTSAHKHRDSGGNCGICGQEIVAGDDEGNYYVSLNEAFDGVADGGTIYVRTYLPNEAFTFNYENKSVTLHGLYGQHLTSNSTDATLTVSAGKLTIGSSPNPKFLPTIINNGGGFALKVTGGSLEFSDSEYHFPGSAILKGGILVTGGGTLEGGLKEGSILTKESGSNSVSVEGANSYEFVYDLLPEGYAFAKYDTSKANNAGDIVEGNVQNLTEDVIVVRCTHTNGSTSLFEDGGCTGCGFACEHTTVENNKCTTCGAQMVAQDNNNKYYLDLSDAFEGVADNGSVTMLATPPESSCAIDFCWDAEGNCVDKTVTLDMNEHSLCWSNKGYVRSVIAIQSGKLIIADSDVSLGYNPNTPAVSVESSDESKGTLEFQGKATITGGLDFSDNGTLEGGLKEGSILKKGDGAYSVSVETSSVYGSVLELLADGCAFAKYDKTTQATGDIVNGYVKQLTEDVIVVQCTHKSRDTSLFENGVCVGCGYECPHENVTSNICTVCGAQMVATDGNGKYYASLETAFQQIENNGTVTMLTTLQDDDTISFCCDAEGKPVEKTVTLMMNGHSLSYEGATSLNIESGKLIIGDDAAISQPASAKVPAVFVDNDKEGEDRGTLEFQGKANLTGGLFFQNYGKLVGGLKEGTTITSNGTYSVSVENSATYSNVLGLLDDGLAFAKKDHPDELVNGNVKELTEDVIVVAHKHSPKCIQNPDPGAVHTYPYICDCGFVCPHDKFTNSICDICHAACTHDEYSSDGTCDRCGAQFAVQVEYTDSVGLTSNKLYMKTTDQDDNENTLQQVFNEAADGSTITLLADGLQAGAFVDDGKNITLDLNGKSLIETSNGIRVDPNSTLKVTGEGSSEKGKDNLSYVFNVQGGTLEFAVFDFGGTFNGICVGSGTLTSLRESQDAITIGNLEIGGANAKISFKAAAFGKIIVETGPVKLGDLLQKTAAVPSRKRTACSCRTTRQLTRSIPLKTSKPPPATMTALQAAPATTAARKTSWRRSSMAAVPLLPMRLKAKAQMI